MEEKQPQQQKNNKDEVIIAQNKLLAVIPAQFAELYNYNTQIQGLKEGTIEKYNKQLEYMQAGYNYKSNIIFALKLLLTNHSPKDVKEIEEIYKKIDFKPYNDLVIASEEGDKIVKLTNNALEYVDDLDEEIEAQEIIDSI